MRALFIWHLLREVVIDRIVDQLQPAWQHALARSSDPDSVRNLDFATLPHGEMAMAGYIAAVKTAVEKELRCVASGTAAPWVTQAVHGAVSDGIVVKHDPIQSAAQTSWLYGDLRVLGFAVGPATVGVLINGQPFGDPVEVGSIDLENTPQGDSFISRSLSAFNDWPKLRKEAHQQLDTLLDELEKRIKTETTSWRGIYRKGHHTRIKRTIPNVTSWLINKERLYVSDRTSANEFLKLIGLETPSTVEKFRQDR